MSDGCPACGGQGRACLAADDYLTGERYSVLQCSTCGHGWTCPSPDDLSRYYPAVYYGDGMKRFPEFMERAIAGSRRRRAWEIHRRVGGGACLDVGCGRGAMLAELAALGWRAVGTELTARSAATAREAGIEVWEGDLESAAFPGRSFDAVTLWHSLEHLPRPERTLRECGRLLRPGGVLVVAVPDFGSLQARMGGSGWFHLDLPRHLHHFTRDSLTRMLAAAGVRPLEWRGFSMEFDPYAWIQSLLNRVPGLTPNALYLGLHRAIGQSSTATRDAALSVLLAPLAAAVALPLVLAGRGAGTLEVWSEPG